MGPRRRADDRRRMGVVTADAIGDGDLTLLELPDELPAIDRHLPPRWSRNNPVDCAGGETRTPS
jgi:acetyltransferase